MKPVEIETFTLIGLALTRKTTNENNQASIDCGELWQKFLTEKWQEKIPSKLNEDVFAVYHGYEKDHTQPYSFFIGCKVQPGTLAPTGLNSLQIATGTYQPFIAKGAMPGCVVDTWNKIWNSDITRAYKTDFEVYNQNSLNWKDAVIEIFIGLND
ncbi:MAG: effector binding domain-containing protein [Bacteroidota bacterium]